MALAVNRTGVIFEKCDLSNHKPDTNKNCAAGTCQQHMRQARCDKPDTCAPTRMYRLEHRAFDWYSGAETTGRTETAVDAYNAGTENWPYLGCQWPALPFVL